jgi:hypothetical protein
LLSRHFLLQVKAEYTEFFRLNAGIPKAIILPDFVDFGLLCFEEPPRKTPCVIYLEAKVLPIFVMDVLDLSSFAWLQAL